MPPSTRTTTLPPEAQSAAQAALDLISRGEAVYPSPTGPQPTTALRDLLQQIGDGYSVEVRCKVGNHRYTKWTLLPERGAVIPTRRPPDPERDSAMEWTERARASHGSVQIMQTPGQGYHGTHDYHCKCGHRDQGRSIPITAEHRLTLYLTAITQGKRTIEI